MVTSDATQGEAKFHLSLEILAGVNSLGNKLHPWNNTIVHQPSEKGKSFNKVNDNLDVVVEFLFQGSVVLSRKFSPELFQGTNWLEEELVLPNPRLWYPVGLGEPNLYQVKIILTKNGNQVDQVSFDYGIRTIDRQATAGPRTADRWENWQFVVNGKKTVCERHELDACRFVARSS